MNGLMVRAGKKILARRLGELLDAIDAKDKLCMKWAAEQLAEQLTKVEESDDKEPREPKASLPAIVCAYINCNITFAPKTPDQKCCSRRCAARKVWGEKNPHSAFHRQRNTVQQEG